MKARILLGFLILIAFTLMAVPARSQVLPRKFYLTQNKVLGDKPLTACAAGYHMASIWEIRTPGILMYDNTLGQTDADSGSGPPIPSPFGWIRTGGSAGNDTTPGSGSNCNLWSTTTGAGTSAYIHPRFFDNAQPTASPWVIASRFCRQPAQVWCISN
jgi:hypothetical protein